MIECHFQRIQDSKATRKEFIFIGSEETIIKMQRQADLHFALTKLRFFQSGFSRLEVKLQKNLAIENCSEFETQTEN